MTDINFLVDELPNIEEKVFKVYKVLCSLDGMAPKRGRPILFTFGKEYSTFKFLHEYKCDGLQVRIKTKYIDMSFDDIIEDYEKAKVIRSNEP